MSSRLQDMFINTDFHEQYDSGAVMQNGGNIQAEDWDMQPGFTCQVSTD